MFKLKTLLLLLLVFLSVNQHIKAQCQEKIDEANRLFDEGIYRDAEKLIKSTLADCDLNKTQENELLKLIASVYYEMDELELGDEYTQEFIKKNPYYISSKKNDPAQFREAIQKLKSFPRFSVGLRGGVPLGYVDSYKVYPVLDSADYSKPYTMKPSFIIGMDFSWNMSSYLSLGTGVGLRFNKIQHQVPQYNQLYFNYEELNSSITLPLTLQFSIPTGGAFVPTFYGGGEVELFWKAAYSYAYTGNSNISKDFSFYLNRKRNNVEINSDERAQYRYGALAGLRLNYKLQKFSIFADCRYVKEFVLYNNPNKRYNSAELIVDNSYNLGDIKLQSIDISVGFQYHFSYKVKSKY